MNKAVSKTLASATAQVQLVISLGNRGSAKTITVEGPIDLQTGDASLEMTWSGSSSSVEALIPSPLDAVVVGGQLYVKASGVLASLDGGKPFALITQSSLEELFLALANLNIGAFSQLATGNFSLLLQALGTRDMTVVREGTLSVASAPASSYRVTINLQEAAQDATPAMQAEFKSLGSSTATFLVALDNQGRLVKLQASATSGSSGSSPGSAQHVDITLTIDQFGIPVSVSAPDPSQVGILALPGAIPQPTTTQPTTTPSEPMR